MERFREIATERRKSRRKAFSVLEDVVVQNGCKTENSTQRKVRI